MPALTFRSISPFATWSLFAKPQTKKSDLNPTDDRVRREYMNSLLSADYCGCGSEVGAATLMALFPRDF